jgi:transglutaminase-like putative cysteine protease
MSILSIHHLTRYRYRKPVRFGEHRLMFRPRESYDQRLISTDLFITPTPVHLHHMQDLFGNCVGVARFEGRASELTFESHVTLDHQPREAFAGLGGAADVLADSAEEHYTAEELADLRPSIQRAHDDSDGLVSAWARRFVRRSGKTSLRVLLSDITQAIYAEFKYNTRLEKGAQTPAETLSLGTGSCRDFAVLMIDAVRSLGLAARFVSGYIYSPYSGAKFGRVGGGHTHAWVRVYLPACGWVEIEPTNGIVGNTDLIRVAIVRDPRQAVPLHGTWAGDPGAYLGMDVEVSVSSEYAEGRQRKAMGAVSAAG